MLVVHWSKHNTTAAILAHGIRPAFRKTPDGIPKNVKGVYVFPYSRHRTMTGQWRRNLKTWDSHLANYNGFIFRLVAEDFPVIAGHWLDNRLDSEGQLVPDLATLSRLYGDFFNAKDHAVGYRAEDGSDHYDEWRGFEIIIPRRIAPNRILRVLRDREPNRARRGNRRRIEAPD